MGLKVVRATFQLKKKQQYLCIYAIIQVIKCEEFNLIKMLI